MDSLEKMDQQKGQPKGPLRMIRHLALRLVEYPAFSFFITVVIAANAVALGLETSPRAMAAFGNFLILIDHVSLIIFVVEISLKLVAYGPRFFRNGWNIFDFVIVAIALIPSAGAFSVLRALRILRTLRLLSVVPQLRAVVGALLAAVPGMGAIIAVLMLVFYVAAVMATKLFAQSFPDWFGTIGASMYTLFQIMTLESWSMGIVRPVMIAHPWAWLFFVPFIIVTSFAVLNMFIALIVNSLQAIHDAENREQLDQAEAIAHDEREALRADVQALRNDIRQIRTVLERLKT